MGGIGGPELLLVLLVVLVVFGPRRIPEIARALGRGMRELQRLSTEFQREINIAEALEGTDRAKGKKPAVKAADAPPPPAETGGADAGADGTNGSAEPEGPGTGDGPPKGATEG